MNFHSPFSAPEYGMAMGVKAFAPVAVLTIVLATGCTPGAPAAPSGGGHLATAVTIEVSLLNYPGMSSAYGMVGGYSPALAIVAHGTEIQFHNQDGFNHTASMVSGPPFPSTSPLSSSALQPSGTDVSQAGWSTGLLAAGSFSKTFTTAAVGQYLYGCYYHYPAGMRGVIVVQ